MYEETKKEWKVSVDSFEVGVKEKRWLRKKKQKVDANIKENPLLDASISGNPSQKLITESTWIEQLNQFKCVESKKETILGPICLSLLLLETYKDPSFLFHTNISVYITNPLTKFSSLHCLPTLQEDIGKEDSRISQERDYLQEMDKEQENIRSPISLNIRSYSLLILCSGFTLLQDRLCFSPCQALPISYLNKSEVSPSDHVVRKINNIV